MEEAILKMIATGLDALSPVVASALTGGQSNEEAIAAARDAYEKLPKRSGPGGRLDDITRRVIDDIPEDEQ